MHQRRMPPAGRANRWWPDDLQALVHQRGRIHRDLRAHRPLRVGDGFAGVMSANSARLRRRNGPPEAVKVMRRDRAGSSQLARHWNTALCSLSIGTMRALPARAATISSSPASTSDSFVGQQQALAGMRGDQGRRQPPGTDDRGDHGIARRRRPPGYPVPPPACATRSPIRRAQSVAQLGEAVLVGDDRMLRAMRGTVRLTSRPAAGGPARWRAASPDGARSRPARRADRNRWRRRLQPSASSPP